MVKHFNKTQDKLDAIAEAKGISLDERKKISRALSNFIFNKSLPFNLSPKALKVFQETVSDFNFFEKA